MRIFRLRLSHLRSFFFFNDTATTEIYTLSLHDALPIYPANGIVRRFFPSQTFRKGSQVLTVRSEEHTSELQSQSNLVCRLLLEKTTLARTVLEVWLARSLSRRRHGPGRNARMPA